MTNFGNVAFGWIGFPVRVPAGQLWARIQSQVASKGVNVAAVVYDYGNWLDLPESVDVLGSSTAASVGTTLTATTAAWTQITASTTRRYMGFVLVPSMADASASDAIRFMRVGVGAAGSEAAYGSPIFVVTDTVERLSFTSSTTNYVRPATESVGTSTGVGARIAVAQFAGSLLDTVQACVIAIPERS